MSIMDANIDKKARELAINLQSHMAKVDYEHKIDTKNVLYVVRNLANIFLMDDCRVKIR